MLWSSVHLFLISFRPHKIPRGSSQNTVVIPSCSELVNTKYSALTAHCNSFINYMYTEQAAQCKCQQQKQPVYHAQCTVVLHKYTTNSLYRAKRMTLRCSKCGKQCKQTQMHINGKQLTNILFYMFQLSIFFSFRVL